MKPDRTQYRQATCDGKQRFGTYDQAQRAARRSRHGGNRGNRRDEAYHCEYCGGFHVGNAKKRPYGKRPTRRLDDESTL